MKILHVNVSAVGGGAEQIIADLRQDPACDSALAVDLGDASRSGVVVLPRHPLERVKRFVARIGWRLRANNDLKVLCGFPDAGNFTRWKLRRVRAYREAMIVHLHNLHGGWFDLAALAAIAREKRIVWTMHDMWPMTGGDVFTYDCTNYQRGVGRTRFAYLHPHRTPWIDRRQAMLEQKRRLYAAIATRTIFVPVSRWLEQAWRAAYVYSPALRTVTVGNGLDTTVFFDRGARTWKVPRVLFFQEKAERKRADWFRGVIESVRGAFELRVVGEGALPARATRIATHVDSRAELAAIYGEADILVFPSRAESFGLIPAEAMACGVCPIVADTTALPEVVVDGAGRRFKADDAGKLRAQMEAAVADLGRTRALGATAAAHARKHFGRERMWAGYREVYAQLVGRETAAAARTTSFS